MGCLNAKNNKKMNRTKSDEIGTNLKLNRKKDEQSPTNNRKDLRAQSDGITFKKVITESPNIDTNNDDNNYIANNNIDIVINPESEYLDNHRDINNHKQWVDYRKKQNEKGKSSLENETEIIRINLYEDTWKSALNTFNNKNKAKCLVIDAGHNEKCDSYINEISNILLQSLIKLTLIFSGSNQSDNKISNDGMKKISNRISNLKSLTELELDFSDNSMINKDGIRSLAEALLKLPSLSRLSLNFEGITRRCNLKDEELELISNSLSKLTSIEDLCLNFSGNNISNKGMKCLIHSIENFNSIKKLSLEFARNEEINNETMNDLADLLNKFISKLTELKLNFRESNITS